MGPGVVRRAVFDSNTVVSALLFPRGRVAWLRQAWRDRRVVPLVSIETTQELFRVLEYPKFRLDRSQRSALLAEYLPFAEEVTVEGRLNPPACRDPHDEKFLLLALAASADWLVTGDDDLLSLAERFPIPIVSPARLAELL